MNCILLKSNSAQIAQFHNVLFTSFVNFNTKVSANKVTNDNIYIGQSTPKQILTENADIL